MIHEDKPDLPTPEEALAHYGVLGMKWGRTRAKANGSEINAARTRGDKASRAINKQQGKVNRLTPKTKEHTAESKNLRKMKVAQLKNPDRVIAARMTRGEKFLVGAMGLAVANIAAPAALPIAIGSIAGTSLRSRRIERKQERGTYDKKR